MKGESLVKICSLEKMRTPNLNLKLFSNSWDSKHDKFG